MSVTNEKTFPSVSSATPVTTPAVFTRVKEALNTAWGVINRREEISARLDEVNTAKFFAINASLWFSSMALFYPAEVLKTRQQVNRAPFTNMITETRTQVRSMVGLHGFRSLYHGFWLTNGTCVLAVNANQAGYMRVRDALEDRGMNAGLAGAASGAAMEICLCPIWIPVDLLAQRIQVSPLPEKGSSYFHAPRGLLIARDIWRQGGIRAFYGGTPAYLLLHVPGAAVAWGTYEVCKRVYHRINDSLFRGGTSGSRLLSEQVLAAMTAATVTASIMNPLDIIKTRIQSGCTHTQPYTLPPQMREYRVLRNSNIVREAYALVQYEGIKALTKGLAPRLAVCLPVMTVESVIYEIALAMSLKHS